MSETKIQWCDYTYNPWIGCTKVSPGCAHCYAAERDKRHMIEKVDHWGKGAPRYRTSETTRNAPYRWNKKPWICEGCGKAFKANQKSTHTRLVEVGVEGSLVDGTATGFQKWDPCNGPYHRARVFLGSLMDIFDPEVPIEWLADALLIVAECKELDFLFVTKRPELWAERMTSVVAWEHEYRGRTAFADYWLRGIAHDNVWMITSTENQEMVKKRVPHLLKIPSVVHGISAEPLLGSLDLSKWFGGEYYPVHERHRMLRGDNLPVREVRGVGDRSTRQGVANKETGMGPLEEMHGDPAMQASQSGEAVRGLPDDQGTHQREALHHSGGEAGLSPLQGTDTERPYHQSRKRAQARQQADEPGASDLFRAADPRGKGAREIRRRETMGRGQSRTQADSQGGSTDTKTPEGKGTTEIHSEGLRNIGSHSIQNRLRPEVAKTLWCICGGESGSGARPMNVEWMQDIQRQCAAAGVAYFAKQLGGKPVCDCSVAVGSLSANCCQHFPFPIRDKKGGTIEEWPEQMRVRQWPTSTR